MEQLGVEDAEEVGVVEGHEAVEEEWAVARYPRAPFIYICDFLKNKFHLWLNLCLMQGQCQVCQRVQEELCLIFQFIVSLYWGVNVTVYVWNRTHISCGRFNSSV